VKISFMSFSTPELSLEEMLNLAADLGYEGIEPRLDSEHAHGVEVAADAEARAAIRDAVAGSDTELACLATSCRYADPEQREQMVADTLERIDLAADVGAPCIRVFGGTFPEELSREDAVAGVAECLSAVAGRAAERGVTVCMETHDAWCDPQHVAEVMQRVGHPAVGVNWDIMHPVRMGLAGIDESFEVLEPWVRHLHIHDGDFSGDGLQLVPIGEGGVDHRRAIELLAGSGYDGFLSGEWINWEPHEQHLPREIATLRNYERELG